MAKLTLVFANEETSIVELVRTEFKCDSLCDANQNKLPRNERIAILAETFEWREGAEALALFFVELANSTCELGTQYSMVGPPAKTISEVLRKADALTWIKEMLGHITDEKSFAVPMVTKLLRTKHHDRKPKITMCKGPLLPNDVTIIWNNNDVTTQRNKLTQLAVLIKRQLRVQYHCHAGSEVAEDIEVKRVASLNCESANSVILPHARHDTTTDVRWLASASDIGSRPEFRYESLFGIGSYYIPYIVLISSTKTGVNEFGHAHVTSSVDMAPFTLPDEFASNECRAPRNDDKVRILRFEHVVLPTGTDPFHLRFYFSRIKYFDYLQSGEYLDVALDKGNVRTFRDDFAPRFVSLTDFSSSRLTNICGVGVFLLTKDNKVVVSRQSASVAVYPDCWSYTASGTMDWDNPPDPFKDVVRECDEEIDHRLRNEDLKLITFGIDTKKLYFQFSFVAHTDKHSTEIRNRAPHGRDYSYEIESVKAIEFTPQSVIRELLSSNWEPAAGATLLTLCIKKYGYESVARYFMTATS